MEKVTIWDDVSFIISSDYRKKVLQELNNPKTPSNLSLSLNINKTHISRALGELSNKNLVKCLTPASKKGRLYIISEYGEKVLKKVISQERNS